MWKETNSSNLDTGQRYFTAELLADPSVSLIRSMGIRSFERSGRPENGDGGRLGGSLISASFACGVN